jgi:hypothetical protein
MNELTLPERVCKILEGITVLGMDETPFGSMVYRFCHVARGHCDNPHEDWLEEFEKTEAEIEAICASARTKKWKEKQSHENETRLREQQ